MSDRTTVAQEIVRAVRGYGVTHAFCVPGESFLATLQAFGEEPGLRVVATRHEEGAGLAAEAFAKATGMPGICLVTRGPGLTHLSIALHTAFQDSTPLLAVVGQVPTSIRYREGFQELDVVEFCRPVSKWAAELTEPDRVGELVDRALHLATSGRPGPVVLSLPENVDRADCAPAASRSVGTFRAAPTPDGLQAARRLLSAARRPCIVAGGGVLRAEATGELLRFAERLDAPVYSGWRRFDVFPNSHRLYRGPLPILPDVLYQPLREADLVIAVGTRLGEFTSLYYTVPAADQDLLFIDTAPEATEAFGAARTAVVIAADPGEALRALADVPAGTSTAANDDSARYQAATAPRPGAGSSTLDVEAIMYEVRRILPAVAQVTSDAGTFAGWLGRYYKWELPRTFYGPTAGGMGYAIPAAIGAKLACPDRPTVAFAGDGGATMTLSEVETAVRLGLAGLVVLVFDNSRYGTIAVHQSNAGMAGWVGTDLGPIDFAAAARALGAYGLTVTRTAEFGPALEEAIAAPRPAVIHIVLPRDELRPWGANLAALDPGWQPPPDAPWQEGTS